MSAWHPPKLIYTSDRVFDGTRPIQSDRLALLRERYSPEGAETELLAPIPAPPSRTSYRWVLWMMLWVTGVLFIMGSALVAMA